MIPKPGSLVSKTSINSQRAKNELWRLGSFGWKFHAGQRDLDALIQKVKRQKQRKAAIRSTRRFGKTYYLGLFATTECIQNPGIVIPFVTTTIKALKHIVIPIFQEILKDCPREYRPKFNKVDGVYSFPNGSCIPLFGTDNGHAEKIRGIKAKHALIDEAGFVDDLKYLVNDILMPALMYNDGIILASSTPPPLADHYFVEYYADCELKDAAILKTIWDNPLLKLEQILDFAEAVGCIVDWENKVITEKSITFRREFEAEIVSDPERKIIPEFTEDREKFVIKEIPLPKFCLKYTILDTGYIDRTAVTFGYWDFANACAYVQDDLNIDFKSENMHTKKLAELIFSKERELWGDEKPYLRFGDGDLIVLNELTQHGLVINPVTKDVLEAQVNQARLDIAAKQLYIHPRARHTIAQLRYGIWDKQRRKFARTDTFAHFDNLASLLYFLRHINRTQNPWPRDHNVDWYNSHITEDYKTDPTLNELKKLFQR